MKKAILAELQNYCALFYFLVNKVNTVSICFVDDLSPFYKSFLVDHCFVDNCDDWFVGTGLKNFNLGYTFVTEAKSMKLDTLVHHQRATI